MFFFAMCSLQKGKAYQTIGGQLAGNSPTTERAPSEGLILGELRAPHPGVPCIVLIARGLDTNFAYRFDFTGVRQTLTDLARDANTTPQVFLPKSTQHIKTARDRRNCELRRVRKR